MDKELEERRRKRKIRKSLLNKIIKLILSGSFNNKEGTPFNIENPLGGARREYYSPVDRNDNNYGWMNINEIGAGTPKNWDR